MAGETNWKQKTLQKKKSELMELILEFFRIFSTKLGCLQELIRLYFPDEEVPTSVTKCRKRLKEIYVNIWDLASGSLRYFEEYQPFRKYTQKRMFPRDMAKEYRLDVFLRYI
jgi:hypothetical protein